MKYALGIDLGTTYTAAAVGRWSEGVPGGRAEVAALGYRATAVPTVVVLTEDGRFLVGDAAERRAGSAPNRVAREFKRRVGDSTPLLLGGTPIAVDRCLAEVLRWVHDTVAETEGRPPAVLTVTHPANWGEFKRDVLREALRLADRPDAHLLAEPVAAATWYAQAERLAPGSTVAVYDLGGGTFDAAVLRRQLDGRFATLGRAEGIERLGGIDIDQAVFGHVRRSLGDLGRLDTEDLGTLAALTELRRECVEAKEALSTETSVTIPVWLPGLHHQVLLQRRELEDLVSPLLAPSVDALGRVIASAGLRPEDLDAVLLVGGSSRVPLIARQVSTGLGRPVVVDAHPKHPVALGAALDAAARIGAPEDGVEPASTPWITTPGPGAGSPNGPGSLPAASVATVGTAWPAGPAPVSSPPRTAPGADGTAVAGSPWASGPSSPAHPAGSPPGPGLARPPLSPPPVDSPGRALPPLPPPYRPDGPMPGPSGRLLAPIGVASVVLVAVVMAVVVTLSRNADGDPDDLAAGNGNPSPAGEDSGGDGAATGDDAPPASVPEARERWTDTLPEAISGVALDEQRAYVTDDRGTIYAYDLPGGTTVWEQDLAEESPSPPVVAGTTVLVGMTNPTVTVALDAASGTQLWSVEHWFDRPLVVGDVVVGTSGLSMHGFDLASGGELWTAELDFNTWSDPVLVGGYVVVASTEGNVAAVDPNDGTIVWTVQVPRGSVTVWGLAAMGDAVVAVDDDAYMTALNIADGTVRWSIEPGVSIFAEPVFVGDVLVTPTESSGLALLNPADGTVLDSFGDYAVEVEPAPGGVPAVIVYSGLGVQAFDLSGESLWTQDLPIDAVDLAVGPNALVVFSSEGELAAFDLGG